MNACRTSHGRYSVGLILFSWVGINIVSPSFYVRPRLIDKRLSGSESTVYGSNFVCHGNEVSDRLTEVPKYGLKAENNPDMYWFIYHYLTLGPEGPR